MTELQEDERMAAYGANDIDSLETLKLSIGSDEIDWRSKILRLQLARLDKALSATVITYKRVDRSHSRDLGCLILSEYTTDVDKQAQIALHRTQGEELACAGKAYINNQVTNVLVFREKLK